MCVNWSYYCCVCFEHEPRFDCFSVTKNRSKKPTAREHQHEASNTADEQQRRTGRDMASFCACACVLISVCICVYMY